MGAGDDRDRRATGDGGGPERGESGLLGIVWGLLGLAWGLGTPWLAWTAMIVSAPFFGEQPTADELAQAMRLMLGALACGLLAPAVGMGLAVLFGRRMAALLFAVALGLSVLAGVATGVLSRDSLRSLRDELAPPTTTAPRPMPCQEHSGGDNRCPGG